MRRIPARIEASDPADTHAVEIAAAANAKAEVQWEAFRRERAAKKATHEAVADEEPASAVMAEPSSIELASEEAPAESPEQPVVEKEPYGPELPKLSADTFRAEWDAVYGDDTIDTDAYLEKLRTLRTRIRSQLAIRTKAETPESAQLASVRDRLNLPNADRGVGEDQETRDLRVLNRQLREYISDLETPAAAETESAPVTVAAERVEEPRAEKIAFPEALTTFSQQIAEGIRQFTNEADMRRKGGMDPFMTNETYRKSMDVGAAFAALLQPQGEVAPETLVQVMASLSGAIEGIQNTQRGTQLIESPESLERLQKSLSALGRGVQGLRDAYPDNAEIRSAADSLYATTERRWKTLGRMREAADRYVYAR